MSSNFYEVLNVQKNADSTALKMAYRGLAMKWHPSKSRGDCDETQKKFLIISEAYSVLSDPEKRRVYDVYGIDGLGNRKFIMYDAFELFRNVFGDIDDYHFGFPGSDVSDGNVHKKLQPMEVPITLTLTQLFHGCTKKIKVTRSINGEDNAKVFELNIKPGTEKGFRFRFEGEGDQIPNFQPQDLVFLIQEAPHPLFTRERSHLVVTQTISLRDALCGTTISLMGIDEQPLSVHISDILAPNQDRRLRGHGMPDKYGKRGDLIFKFKITFPEKLTPEQRSGILQYLPA